MPDTAQGLGNSIEQIAEMDAYEADYAARQYQRERHDLYPGIREQLDLLWHAID